MHIHTKPACVQEGSRDSGCAITLSSNQMVDDSDEGRINVRDVKISSIVIEMATE
jgi:hypothetical protein